MYDVIIYAKLRSLRYTGEISKDNKNYNWPEFHADVSRYKEIRVHCTVIKTPIFLSPFYASLTQGAKVLTREI